jgi:N-succinyldiaminopimelate aminotransferase
MNPLYAQIPTSIFAHMSGLALEHGAVNLGQGFPDFGWPDDVVARAAEELTSGSNQYAPMRGVPELRAAVADHYRRHQDLDYAADDVTVTSGATEALAASLLALIEPGDEVVLMQPLYDAYLPLVLRAGGVARLVSLEPPEWRLTEQVAAAITERTRLLVFNNPHNPTARLFGVEELRLLAQACVRHDVTVISDEVWEHVVFDGGKLVPLAALPAMRERTVKIGSAGKIFSLTGWKVGWAVAPAPLAELVAKGHQFLTFATAPNLQRAVAYGLGKEQGYFDGMRFNFEEARDYLASGLKEAGFVTTPVEGTYFINVDLAASGIRMDDVTFSERAVREAGVAVIPLSSLYAEDAAGNVARLCFAKQRDTLDAGIAKMRQARELFAR